MHPLEKKLIIIGIIVFVAIIISYGSYVYYAYHHIDVVDVEITKLSDLSLEGMTIHGKLKLHNPHYVRLFIADISYDILLNNNRIGSGSIDGEKLYGLQTKEFDFRHELIWHPSVEYLRSIASEDRTHFSIKGNVHLRRFGINMYFPFETEMDLERYIPEMILGFTSDALKLATDQGVMMGWGEN
ncbi:LEA type 2 family protein [Candidatus Woesearchaeota archaeon]|nr:LEA type 2 family protein [Candidatus Woesearchaeota archaeon]